MRKSRREVTRKNQKTDEPRITRMSPIGTTETTQDDPDLTTGSLIGARKGHSVRDLIQCIVVTASETMLCESDPYPCNPW
jgi:hypothetical protein